MVWFNVDDTMAFHRKTIQAGNPAIGLWTRAGAWCASTLTDGFVPKAIARSLGTSAQARALVRAGLWTEENDGYRFHEWEQRQRTKAEVESKREADRLRKADQRKGKSVPVGQPPDVATDSTMDSTADSDSDSPQESQGESHMASTPPFLSIPFHSSSSGYVGEVSLVATARENDPPLPHCEDHPGGTPAPCGACGTARKRWIAWNLERDQAAEAAEKAHRERLHQDKLHAAEDRARAITNCGMCDDAGYVNASLCTHDPDETDRAKRGMAEIRARMKWESAS
ncbi:hypothetical protein [Nocardia australiensis]|uniref:hypothetical protein n=1 Tax=Nocardia australiensis TaxID=2887191 RepID=UPI001D13964C|nr:hypothetical protein [Nocardia australiensis]